MIRLDMSREELLKEMNADELWAYGRINGIHKKFNRYLKSKPAEGVFYRCWYTTPNKNKICIVYSVERTCGIMDLRLDTFFRFVGDDGKERYIFNHFTPDGLFVSRTFLFTNHFIQRLKERVGMDFESWFVERVVKKEVSFDVFDYDYNDEDNQCYAILNGNMAFGVRSEAFDVVFKTLITMEQEYLNQLQLHQHAFKQNCIRQEGYSAAQDAFIRSFINSKPRSVRRLFNG